MSKIRWTGIVLIATPAVMVVMIALDSAKDFEQLFADFNVELPYLTRFAYDWYPWTLVFLGLIAPLAWLTKADAKRTGLRAAAWVGMFVASAIYLMWLIAMGIGLYIPFDRLSQAA